MSRDFPSRAGSLFLALLLSLSLAAEGAGRTSRPPAGESAAVEGSGRSQAAENLAQEVAEIAHSAAISRAKKEKRISTAVRVAVVAATAYKNDPEGTLGTAVELAEAAAAAAPAFAEVIANAIAFAPSLARIDAAPGQVRTAAYAAAKNPQAPRKSHRTVARSRLTAPPLGASDEISSPSRRANPSAGEEPASSSRSQDYVADANQPDQSLLTSKADTGNNSKFALTAVLSVRRDDNVYTTTNNKKSDTIIAVTPGVAFQYGQNSLTHGSVSYKNSFTRYVDKSAPNAALSNAAANFGYDNGSLAVAGAASFQQTNQNNSDVAALGQQAIYRRDLLGASANLEAHLTAKTSVMTGANYNKSEYKTGGLIGSQETEVPVKVYLEITPKVSLSTGFSYRKVQPQNGAQSGRDLDYNIGARGTFTPKLTGQFSLDYRTRDVGSSATEKLWGFNGSFDYELSPKVTSSLVLARDFSTGALGESLKNSNYSVKLAADLTRQWQLGTGLTYRQVAYGPAVFSLTNPTAASGRNDHYWEGNLQATYLFRSWLSASADYTLRNNHSTLPGAQFSNNIFSLMLGWQY